MPTPPARAYLAAANGGGATLDLDARRRSAQAATCSPASAASPASPQIAGDADKLLEIAADARRRGRRRRRRAPTRHGPRSTRSPSRPSKTRSTERRAPAGHRRPDGRCSACRRRLASSSVSFVADAPADSGQLSDQGWSLPVAGRPHRRLRPAPEQAAPRRERVPPRHRYRGRLPRRPCSPRPTASSSQARAERQPTATGCSSTTVRASPPATPTSSTGGTVRRPRARPSRPGSSSAVGSTGASTGCHLHFEVHLDGIAVNAVPFMAARGIALG